MLAQKLYRLTAGSEGKSVVVTALATISDDFIFLDVDKPVCPDVIKALTYGVTVIGNRIVAGKKSGLTERGKKLLKTLGARVEKNQIAIAALLAVVALAALCYAYPNVQVCKDLRFQFNDVLIPLIVFGLTLLFTAKAVEVER